MRLCVILTCAFVLLAASRAAGPAHAQMPAGGSPALEILSPPADAYLSGATVLRAGLTPAAAASRVLFYVDGRQVCQSAAEPFECSWEAGTTIAAHQIRVVAELTAGGRVVRTVRTKALGYA
jgi:hypothetical protein